ncbi:MAG TPA: type IV toxin-antitoxin system AbiEi family antitoxin domain-containing protein [Candidatus Ligilactobacillus excrementipullorum]|nr:type IV toxin-antitoxin system AbiEi family antitoxin domain-containing protein [Candidatus Ligilactobacillus excrementipullorum]
MTQKDLVLEYLSRNGGQINAKQAEQLGVSARTLRNMYAHDELERLAPGVYISPFELGDDFASLQYRLSKGIFFKDSALFLWGMIDRTPARYEMNFPLPYSYGLKKNEPLKIYRQSEKLYQIGITEVKTPGGNMVRVYDIERTLCDILRQRDRSDSETIKQAMNSYIAMNDKNISRLVEYANLFHVRDEVQKYMEVLL